MNAVEIEDAVTRLAEKELEAAEFPYQFLTAFGNKDATIKRLRAGSSNASDVSGGVLQRNNIHIAVATPGTVTQTLATLRASPATTKAKARFILATDGDGFEAEELESGETIACTYADFPNHFGFFLPLAGITTVKQIRESSFDIRATGRLNRLYVELLKDNADWGAADRRPDMNHFMARLIFCFFAEDTDIFHGKTLFTKTVEQMSARDSSNTHEIISELFLAMNTALADRATAKLPRWAEAFPYVNGGLFSGSPAVPRFSRIARSYLLHIGGLDWTKINPDIFGSMIQAVADDEERGALGMHYTSVPNILKVLNPLFLDDLRARLLEAGDNSRMLLNLRRRMARIRVFDPACGSGNFLVIAYKQMREIEAEINNKRNEANRASEIPKTSFRGIELRDFPAEIARLALIIAEFQCDVLYRGQQLALAEFLPLDRENWITCGNALTLDWMGVCPHHGTVVKVIADDLFRTPLDQAQIDFENEGGETYICGNPPYLGKGKKEKEHQDDMDRVFSSRTKQWGYVDYVGCWLVKAADYCRQVPSAASALVTTNSVCQGRQVSQLWPVVLGKDVEIGFAHSSFKWANSAMHNAGVSCVIIGLNRRGNRNSVKALYGDGNVKEAKNINTYLVDAEDIFVDSESVALSKQLPKLITGSVPNDGGNLIFSLEEKLEMLEAHPECSSLFKRFLGSKDFIQGEERACLLIGDEDLTKARAVPEIVRRLNAIVHLRLKSPKKETRDQLARIPHRFQHVAGLPKSAAMIIPSVSSEIRAWFPVGYLGKDTVVSNLAFFAIDPPVWAFALACSKLHLVWLATVCGKLETRYRYSNTLGWNTFPLPTLTEKNKADLTRCAVDILLTREAHFPATIADLYDPNHMPPDLRQAHERNDEVFERIYIGRRFRNDTERLEKLFELYTKMATAPSAAKNARWRRTHD